MTHRPIPQRGRGFAMTSTDRYDVVVAGGGSAGVAAAVGAARPRARAQLIERGPGRGGAAARRHGLPDCGVFT
ncbi:FAD-dependent oxidoreductase, partial [Nocardia wallacei]|uniref:FAD-dependent oxidoreductase n=1 Tax=Nocardia wallacei TaxID=480035 RepID=UPI00313D0B73